MTNFCFYALSVLLYQTYRHSVQSFLRHSSSSVQRWSENRRFLSVMSTESTETEKSSPLKQLKVLSYNIDGLNNAEDELQERMMYILGIILSQSPHVIHLQEVVPQALTSLYRTLQKNGYECSINPTDRTSLMSLGGYFTLSFVKKDIPNLTQLMFQRQSFTTPQSQSQQGRYIQKTTFQINDIKYMFINCHLESCGTAFKSAESSTRQAQLRVMLDQIMSWQTEGPGIVAGDTNLRNPEATAVLKGYPSIVDVAERVIAGAGGKGAVKVPNTWICPGKPSVQCRFDRFYYNNHPSLIMKDVVIVGQEPLLSDDTRCGYLTPSDHYGLLTTFDIAATSNSIATEARSETDKAEETANAKIAVVRRSADDRGADQRPLKRQKREIKSTDVIDLT